MQFPPVSHLLASTFEFQNGHRNVAGAQHPAIAPQPAARPDGLAADPQEAPAAEGARRVGVALNALA